MLTENYTSLNECKNTGVIQETFELYPSETVPPSVH